MEPPDVVVVTHSVVVVLDGAVVEVVDVEVVDVDVDVVVDVGAAVVVVGHSVCAWTGAIDVNPPKTRKTPAAQAAVNAMSRLITQYSRMSGSEVSLLLGKRQENSWSGFWAAAATRR